MAVQGRRLALDLLGLYLTGRFIPPPGPCVKTQSRRSEMGGDEHIFAPAHKPHTNPSQLSGTKEVPFMEACSLAPLLCGHYDTVKHVRT
ncbi:unnamed protein product [Schistocephalus solidus]|uniref:Secreted protein n=1 Tax=Schistocephalus solidus TaxID=70667 RepID=A0A183SPF3_SCHSO|nr:unnamed protein product [Schistocephalus solidus]